MIDVITIRILDGIKGLPSSYVGEARWIDKDNNIDKCFTIANKDLDSLVEQMSDKLTEVLCR